MNDDHIPAFARLKRRLLTIKQAADGALEEIARREELKAAKWKCSACGHARHFTRPVTVAACESCPKCQATAFDPVPL